MPKRLIEALTIFEKYTDCEHITHCEHDELTIDVSPEDVSDEDKAELAELGFVAGDDHFLSYEFGSC